MKKITIVLCLISLSWLQSMAFGQIKELRGVWLTKTASSIFNSKANIAAAIDSLKKTGLNAVFPGIFENGFTLYPSEVMEVYTGNRVDYAYVQRDLLAEIIAEAHRVGMEVHPWFEFGFATCYGSRGPVLEHYPQWAGKRISTGDALDDNSFYWLSQAHPEVQEFLISLALEVVANYDVDGIMFDRIRYGLTKNSITGELIASDFGYDEAHVERYRAANNGQDPPASPRDSNWMKWRSQILDEFVALLYDSVKAHNPNIMVTNTPVVYPYGYNLFLQNWPQWVRDNSIDFISPQVYRFSVNDYRRDLGTIVNQQLPAGYKRCYPGMLIREGSYNATPELAVNFIKENRNLGVEGGIFFFYEGLPSVASALRQQVFQQPAIPAYRSENWRPEGIIIQEDHTLAQLTGNWIQASGAAASSYFSFDGRCLTATGSSGAKIRYLASIALPGWYDVYVYQLYGNQLAADIPVTLLFDNNKVVRVDETDNLNKGWIKVGTGHFDTGSQEVLEIGTAGVSSTKIVAADGIMLLLNRRLTSSGTGIRSAKRDDLPADLMLLRIYPNPFNAAAIIDFALPRQQNIRVLVFDMLGRHIVTLAKGWHHAGRHRLVLDASQLPGGVYFCQLIGDGFKQTKKLVLVK